MVLDGTYDSIEVVEHSEVQISILENDLNDIVDSEVELNNTACYEVNLNNVNIKGHLSISPESGIDINTNGVLTDVQDQGNEGGIVSTVTGGASYVASSAWGVVYTAFSGTGYLIYDSIATVSLGAIGMTKSFASWVVSHYY